MDNDDIRNDPDFKKLCALLEGLPEERREVFLSEMEKKVEAENRIDGDKMYQVDEVAQILGITPFTVRKWLREGKIKGKKIGRPWMIPKAEVQRLLSLEDE